MQHIKRTIEKKSNQYEQIVIDLKQLETITNRLGKITGLDFKRNYNSIKRLTIDKFFSISD